MELKGSRVCAELKHAYKDGYSIYIDQFTIAVKTYAWMLQMNRKSVPPKVLGLLVEHIGSLDISECMQVQHDCANQIILRESADKDLELLRQETPNETIPVPLMYKSRYPLFQQVENMRIVGFDADLLSMADTAKADAKVAPFLRLDETMGTIEDECGRWRLLIAPMSRQKEPVMQLLEGFDFNIPELQHDEE